MVGMPSNESINISKEFEISISRPFWEPNKAPNTSEKWETFKIALFCGCRSQLTHCKQKKGAQEPPNKVYNREYFGWFVRASGCGDPKCWWSPAGEVWQRIETMCPFWWQLIRPWTDRISVSSQLAPTTSSVSQACRTSPAPSHSLISSSDHGWIARSEADCTPGGHPQNREVRFHLLAVVN